LHRYPLQEQTNIKLLPLSQHYTVIRFSGMQVAGRHAHARLVGRRSGRSLMFHSEGLGNKISSLFHVHSASNLPTRASIATISFPISPALCLRNHVSSLPMVGIRAVALVLYNKSLFSVATAQSAQTPNFGS